MTSLPHLGALERWQAEIRAGVRQNTIAAFDDLAAAAANEAAAHACLALGKAAAAAWFMDRALLRLDGCYLPDPHDGTPAAPGPGRRRLHALLTHARSA